VSPRRERRWRAATWLGAGLLLGAAALVLGPFLVPVRRPEGLLDPEDLADPDSRFVDVAGVTLHVKEAGDSGSPCTLVFLHGFASSVYAWRDVMRAMAPRARVIAFDRPGFGLSSRPLGTQPGAESPYSMESSVRQTIALMDALGVERTTLVGHSQGAAIALMVADAVPERVSALVLVSSPTASTRFRQRPALDRLRRLPQVRHLAPLVPRPFFGKHARWFMAMAYHDPSRLSAETVELERKASHVKDWDLALVELKGAQTGFHSPDAMARVHVPTLLVAGREDSTVPFADQVAAARAIPGAHLVALPATGYVPQEERPAAFAEALADFLDRLGC